MKVTRFLFLLSALVLFAACDKDDDNVKSSSNIPAELVGKWVTNRNDGSLEIFADGIVREIYYEDGRPDVRLYKLAYNAFNDDEGERIWILYDPSKPWDAEYNDHPSVDYMNAPVAGWFNADGTHYIYDEYGDWIGDGVGKYHKIGTNDDPGTSTMPAEIVGTWVYNYSSKSIVTWVISVDGTVRETEFYDGTFEYEGTDKGTYMTMKVDGIKWWVICFVNYYGVDMSTIYGKFDSKGTPYMWDDVSTGYIKIYKQ
jgi:hypothetical protein